jgi:hypothetical protein
MWMLLSQDIRDREYKVATGKQRRKECRKDANACLIMSILQSFN